MRETLVPISFHVALQLKTKRKIWRVKRLIGSIDGTIAKRQDYYERIRKLGGMQTS
jgi:hypothetical protein